MRVPLAALALALAPLPLGAQFLSAGAGGGKGVGRHAGPDSASSHAHLTGWVQVGAPFFPLAVRGEALLTRPSLGGGPLAFSASAVLSAPIPVVTPYATAGWGTYGVGGEGPRVRGWSAGVGVRAKLPALPGFYAEVRRHQRLGRDLATVGVVF